VTITAATATVVDAGSNPVTGCAAHVTVDTTPLVNLVVPGNGAMKQLTETADSSLPASCSAATFKVNYSLTTSP